MKDKTSLKNSSQPPYRNNKTIWVPGKRGWWCIALGLVTTIVVIGILFTTSLSRQQHQESVQNIQRMHSQLAIVATSLNKIQPDNSWVDKSTCYVTEDKGFGYESTHFCEAKFEMAYRGMSLEQAEVYVASSSELLKSLSVVNQLQVGNRSTGYESIEFPFGFLLLNVKQSAGTCGLVYRYFETQSRLDGQMNCLNQVDETVFEMLGDKPF